MRCHYEVLGLTQTPSDDDLKKAYRKMALQWHPDKNPDNLEEANSMFQLIQAAYDTLSDPQERAFYDRNRESILRGKASGDTKSEKIDLFAYFSSSCYTGFNDSEKGFYTVYRQLFESITSKEMEYRDDDDEFCIPNFGRSDSELEDVTQFYGYWSSFCTCLCFSWADRYDIREAQTMGRYVEKKIKKENKTFRDKARKEYNEEIRSLVMFVKKRDKRWDARKKMLEAKVAENAQKQKADQQRKRDQRKQLLEETMEIEKEKLSDYEKQLKAMEAQFADEWGISGSESEDEEELETIKERDEDYNEDKSVDCGIMDNLYCVSCNKSFKTDKAMESHKRSKKHKENEEILKVMITSDDSFFKRRDIIPDMELADSTDSEGKSSISPSNTIKKKKKKNKRSNNFNILEGDQNKLDVSPEVTSEKSWEEVFIGIPNGLERINNFNSINGESENNSNIVLRENEVLLATEKDNLTENLTHSKNNKDEIIDENKQILKPKLKGKKAKEAKKKEREATVAALPQDEKDKDEICCTVCGQKFSSKTKLFNHIKDLGHAALKTQIPTVNKKGKTKKK